MVESADSNNFVHIAAKDVTAAVDVAALAVPKNDTEELALAMQKNDNMRRLEQLRKDCAALPEPDRGNLLSDLAVIEAQIAARGPGSIAESLITVSRNITLSADNALKTSEAARDEAISGRVYPLSAAAAARVADRMAALDNNDIKAFSASFIDKDEKIPTEITPDVTAMRDGANASPELKETFEKHKQWKREDPKGYQENQERIEALRDQAKKLLVTERAKHPPRADLLKTLHYLSQPGPTADPNADKLIAAIEDGASAAEIEKLKAPIVQQHGEALSKFMPIARHYGKPQVDAYIKSQPADVQGELGHNDGALAKRIAQTLSNTDETEQNIALATNPLQRTSRQSEIVSAYAIGKSAEATVVSTMALRHLDRSLELEREGKLDAETRDNIAFVQSRDEKNTLLRAEKMIEGTLKHAGSAVLANSAKADGGNQARALGVLTLGFADQHGGLPVYAQHSKILTSLQDPRLPQPSKEAVDAAQQYMSQYQAYLGKTLLGVENVDPNDSETTLRLTVALERMGADLKSGALSVESRSDGSLAFTDRNSYLARDSAYANSEFRMREYKDTAADLYNDARKELTKLENGEEANFSRVRAALLIDTYRLYDTKEGQVLIDAMIAGEYKGRDEVLVAKVEELGAATSERMGSYSDDIRMQLTRDLEKLPKVDADKRIATLIEIGALSEDGSKLDLNYIMDGAAWAKYKFQPDYQKYSNWTPEELLAGKKGDVTITDGQERYEGRLMYSLASQYYAAQMLDNVGMEYEKIQKEAKALGDSGQEISEKMQLDLVMYETLNADPETKTRQQKLEAINRLLDRDAYISGKGREQLKQSAIGIMVEHLDSEAHHQHAHKEGQAQDHVHDTSSQAVPEVHAQESVSTGEKTPADIKDIYSGTKPIEFINENEGAGLLDKLEMDPFETQIFEAIKGLSAESRRTMFGESKILNEVNKGAQGDQAIYSYNEIETALKRLKLNDVSKIADVNGNGFDAEDIRAALVPNLAVNSQGQGKA